MSVRPPSLRRLFPALLLAAAVAPAAWAAAGRTTQDLAAGWTFTWPDAAGGTAGGQDVTLPHTWNALDGQDGRTPGQTPRANERGSDYRRGTGWYARTLDAPESWRGRRVFVRFEAASQVARVFLNGTLLGEHRGAFTAFCFELTSHLRFGGANELRVEVDNRLVPTVAPLAGDFNVDGGLYRRVSLLVTDPVCVSPLDHASPGVYLTLRDVSADAATIEVRTMLTNGLATPAPVRLSAEIRDATGRVVAAGEAAATVAAGAPAQPVVQTLSLPQPHRWNGRDDPYLYAVTVRVRREGATADEVVQPLGVRTVALTDRGFLLNGRPYPVFGVCRHQDLRDHGWALTPADDARDIRLIAEMGATAIRLAHYPQDDTMHRLADETGLLLWEEVPFVNDVPDATESPEAPGAATRAFASNLEDQMREMILQRYNHPSVAWWGVFNELRPNPTSRVAQPIVARLNALAHELDPGRPTVAASDKLGNPTNFITDSMGYNVYPGWYTGAGAPGELTALIAARSAEQKGRRVALSEYGAGGNPWQHEEGPPAKPQANGGPIHPEEWQSLMHERDWAQIKGSPGLWGSFAWAMFDFSSDGRAEGGTTGINDKGLVSQDRGTRKDAYYFYQANWSRVPMVRLASSRLTPRHEAVTDVKAYSNCPEVELVVDGRSVGVARPDDIGIARWPGVALHPGDNTIEAIGRDAGAVVRDRCEWQLANPPAP